MYFYLTQSSWDIKNEQCILFQHKVRFFKILLVNKHSIDIQVLNIERGTGFLLCFYLSASYMKECGRFKSS